jgi:hypothetical protein
LIGEDRGSIKNSSIVSIVTPFMQLHKGLAGGNFYPVGNEEFCAAVDTNPVHAG